MKYPAGDPVLGQLQSPSARRVLVEITSRRVRLNFAKCVTLREEGVG